MYSKESTREHAALQLLNVSHRLSVGAHIFRPIELQVQQQAKADLVVILDELSKLGYAKDCSPSTATSSALSTLEAHSEGTPLPFTTALHISQLLLQSVQFLSPSPSPFPVPNRHLPPEILHLIYKFLLDEEPAAVRQKAIVALSATSVLWRQIVSERPVIYLDSLSKLAKYSKLRQDWIISDPTRWERSWKDVEIDLSREELPGSTVEAVAGEICAAEEGKRIRHDGKLLLNLDNKYGRVSIDGGALNELLGSLGEWKHFTIKIAGDQKFHYLLASSGLDPGRLEEEEAREFYIGRTDDPIELDSDLTYQMFSEVYDARDRWKDGVEDLDSGVPVLTNYSLFAAPWLTFDLVSFLLGMVGKIDDQDLPTSPLRHLELSYEVNGSNPADASLDIQVLFTVISPNIEYLSLRLRLSSPHPSIADEDNFSAHLSALLTTCKRLRHLEIGGFGFSPKLITHLFALPLETLIILPLQYVPPLHMIPGYFRFARPLLILLKSLKKFGIDSRLISERDWENVITASHENDMVGLQLVRENRVKENDLLRKLMRRVGIS